MIGTGLFWQTLKRDIQKHRTHIVEDMCSGMPSTYDQYRDMVGQVDALDWILQRASELLGEDKKLTAERKREYEEQIEEENI